MYGIGGEHDLSERELPHLRGWRDSRPVRVGNGAWDQTQLDVYGELLNALHLYRERLGELHPEIQRFVADLADAAARGWQRDRRRHVGDARRAAPPPLLEGAVLDGARPRGQARARSSASYAKAEEWAAERDAIREAILERGWSEKRQAYAQSFDSDELDAAALLMPIVGFLPADRRAHALDDRGDRARPDRGRARAPLPQRARASTRTGSTGEEGTFVICSFWLVSCLAQAGEVERAEALFDQLAGYANDLGLLAEEIDTGRTASCSATSRRRSATSA